jgi:hypothetical protein
MYLGTKYLSVHGNLVSIAATFLLVCCQFGHLLVHI